MVRWNCGVQKAKFVQVFLSVSWPNIPAALLGELTWEWLLPPMAMALASRAADILLGGDMNV
jgi:hypothetical protein